LLHERVSDTAVADLAAFVVMAVVGSTGDSSDSAMASVHPRAARPVEGLEVLLDFGMLHLAPASGESPAVRPIIPDP
jgi:hypothetical protein